MSESPRSGLNLDRFKSPLTGAERRSAPASGPGAPASSGRVSEPDTLSLVARERRVAEILSTLEGLPSLPAIVTEVLQLANDADTQTSDFEEVIRKDQALVAKVLKLVNSPFFGLREKINSISQAVVVLGFKSLKSVVLAAKTNRLLDRQLHQYGLEEGGLWKHSISTATICQFLAGKAGIAARVQEELFIAGLLHDVGKILLAPHISGFQAEFDAALERNGGDLVGTETALVGVSHPEIGGLMARKWGLAPQLETIIRDHHRLDDIGEPTSALPVVQLADELCNRLGIGITAGPKNPSPAAERLRAATGLRASTDELLEEVRARLDEMESVFQEMLSDRKDP